MTDSTIKDLTNDELDRAGAVEVMEWKWQESAKIFMDKEGQVILGGRHWSPSTSPTDDYAVLVHVRENWDEYAIDEFVNRVANIERARADEPMFRNGVILFYQTGDYEISALETVRETPHDRP